MILVIIWGCLFSNILSILEFITFDCVIIFASFFPLFLFFQERELVVIYCLYSHFLRRIRIFYCNGGGQRVQLQDCTHNWFKVILSFSRFISGGWRHKLVYVLITVFVICYLLLAKQGNLILFCDQINHILFWYCCLPHGSLYM